MKILLAVVMLAITSSAFAQKVATGFSYSMPAAELGFKWSSANLKSAVSDKQEVGIQIGVSSVFNFAANLGVKSGLFYSERPFKSEYVGSTAKGKLSYFEVPLHLMFKFEDYAGVYVGPALAVKLGDESSPTGLTEIKSLVLPITFGAQFKFLPNLGANVFFETVPGELANGVSNSKAVGINILISLD